MLTPSTGLAATRVELVSVAIAIMIPDLAAVGSHCAELLGARFRAI